MPNSTYPFNVGDRIFTGDYIGDIATRSVSSFHHVHFNHVVGTGGLPWSWYSSIDNPLDFLNPNAEPQPPTIYNATGQNLLAFCVNNTSTYLNPNSLSGDVDIFAKIGDKIWNNQWEVIPYRIAYTIAGGSFTDTRQAFVFNGLLPSSSTVLGVVYKDDATCNTEGNYNLRNFFFVRVGNERWESFPAGGLYVTDSIGDITGGILFSFVLVYSFTPFVTVAITSGLLIAAVLVLFLLFRRYVLFFLTLVFTGLFFMFSLNSHFEKVTLSPQYGEILRYVESPYGRIVVTKEGPQHTFWESGTPFYSDADIVNSEEKIHYALSQLEEVRSVLLVSGGLGETLSEVSKYAPATVDYVERFCLA